MQSRELLRFYLTGERPLPSKHTEAGLRPAALAPFRDLAQLRYDYPLVLVEDGDVAARTLSDLFNEILAQVAPPGPAGERLRRHVLRLEQRIRDRVANDGSDTLSRLWKATARALLAECDKREGQLLKESLTAARRALTVDGPVVDCDRDIAPEFAEHAWRVANRRRTEAAQADIEFLILQLTSILQADHARSEAGLAPDRLAASVGATHHEDFDFTTWSRLATRTRAAQLTADRRRRIESILSVLRNQRFFPGGKPLHSFRFDSCSKAAAALGKRMPEMLELVKAMTAARLEIDNRYREEQHDAFFAAFGEASPTAEDLALFPAYLVCVQAADLIGAEKAELVDILGSRLPIKVVVETAEVFDWSPSGDLDQPPGLVGGQLGNLALGLGEAFVMQGTAADLPRMQREALAGMSYPGPALFNVFNGAVESSAGLPAFLTAAAAARSRAFPSFTYDPAAGPDWASRFRIDGNPQVASDWPEQELTYEDDTLQRVSEESVFTFVDFAACDERLAAHFLAVPRAAWSEDMEPAWVFLNGEPPAGKVPYVVAVSLDNELRRLVVGSQVIEAARRCRSRWRNLQELGGIHNSHARRLLEEERARWEEEKAQELKDVAASASATAVIEKEQPVEQVEEAEPPATEPVVVEEPPAPTPDEAYIETARCTTCDECTAINSKMFAYDDNKQAHIADLTAGTFRQLVEAAEACQVAIIHPGKPWDLNEPDLDALIQRAEAFQ